MPHKAVECFSTRPIRVRLVSVKILSIVPACHEERCIFNHNWHLLVDFDCIGCCPRGCNPVRVTDINDLLSTIFFASVALKICFCKEDNRLMFYSQVSTCVLDTLNTLRSAEILAKAQTKTNMKCARFEADCRVPPLTVPQRVPGGCPRS